MAGGGVDAGGFLLHADWPYNENTIIRNALMYAEPKYNENTINETFIHFFCIDVPANTPKCYYRYSLDENLHKKLNKDGK